MKLLMSILFVIILCLGISVFADASDVSESLLIKITELEGGNEFLISIGEKIELLGEALMQIEADQEEINLLRLQRDTFEQQLWEQTQHSNHLENELRHIKGLHLGIGGGISYNKTANVEVILLYKFSKSAVYLSGGYPSITVGYLHKINTGR